MSAGRAMREIDLDGTTCCMTATSMFECACKCGTTSMIETSSEKIVCPACAYAYRVDDLERRVVMIEVIDG